MFVKNLCGPGKIYEKVYIVFVKKKLMLQLWAYLGAYLEPIFKYLLMLAFFLLLIV